MDRVVGLVFGLFLLPFGAAAAEVPFEGLWMTENGDARIRIASCGDEVCGNIVWMLEPNDETGRPRIDSKNPDPALRDRPVMGLTLLRFTPEPDEDGVYRECRIYDPKRGDAYRCKLRQEDDQLRIRGFIGISLIGRTTHWTPVLESARE